MLFQIGSNWGGDRKQPLVEARADSEKLEMLSSLLHESGWTNFTVAYAHHEEDKRIEYSEQHELMKSKNDNGTWAFRSEEHTFEIQSLMSISYAVFCLKKKNNNIRLTTNSMNYSA